MADLERIPQTAFAFVQAGDAPLLSPARQAERAAEFRTRWFAPWKRSAPAYRADDVFWGFSAFAAKAWGQDLRPRPKSWMEALERNARRETYPNLVRPAVALRRLDLRVLPVITSYSIHYTKLYEIASPSPETLPYRASRCCASTTRRCFASKRPCAKPWRRKDSLAVFSRRRRTR